GSAAFSAKRKCSRPSTIPTLPRSMTCRRPTIRAFLFWSSSKEIRSRTGSNAVRFRPRNARYLPTGYIVYAFGGTLFAVPFDLGKLVVTGGPVPVIEGVRRGSNNTSGAVHYSFSNNGTLIYIPGSGSAANDPQVLALMDRKGTVEPLKVQARSYGFPRVSPDGKR